MTNAAGRGGLDGADIVLLVIFIIGIYTGINLQITDKVPVPSVIAGVSGLALFWRRRNDIAPSHLMAFLLVIVLYLASILAASDLAYLPKRSTGFVQLVYSLTLGYAVFLTVLKAERRQLAAVTLGFCLVILVGALLEDYVGLRPISDAVRRVLYSKDVIYNADLRDFLLYGRIRPKFFASEPSAVTFAFTFIAFIWLLVSTWRWKVAAYLALMGAGMFAMPGPTLLLMVLLLIPYAMLATRHRVAGFLRLIAGLCACGALIAAFAVLGETVYAARLHEILSGQDASFFLRVIGPALLARNVIATHPIAGAGLTGDPLIAKEVVNVFMQSPDFSPAWRLDNPGDPVANYFWMQWIYLGLVWGAVTVAAMSLWLKVLDVPSVPFCWVVWSILGQASGAYVGPKTWAVLFLAAAGAIVFERARAPAMSRPPVSLVIGGGRATDAFAARQGPQWRGT